MLEQVAILPQGVRVVVAARAVGYPVVTDPVAKWLGLAGGRRGRPASATSKARSGPCVRRALPGSARSDMAGGSKDAGWRQASVMGPRSVRAVAPGAALATLLESARLYKKRVASEALLRAWKPGGGNGRPARGGTWRRMSVCCPGAFAAL